jgi:hypothetical protein
MQGSSRHLPGFRSHLSGGAWRFPSFCARFSRFGYGSFFRFGYGFNWSRQFRLGRFLSAVVAMVQRLDARSFFFRPQLSVCIFSVLILDVFRHVLVVMVVVWQNYPHPSCPILATRLTIHQAPRGDWTKRTTGSHRPAVLPPLPGQIRNGAFFHTGSEVT